MQSAGLPAVIFQDKLIQSSSRSVLFGAVIADNLEQATNLVARIKKLPTVSDVETMATYLAGDQTRKLELIHQIKQNIATDAELDRGGPCPAANPFFKIEAGYRTETGGAAFVTKVRGTGDCRDGNSLEQHPDHDERFATESVG